MFNKDSFLHYHTTNAHTGFRPDRTVYEGFVQDAEGKPWGFLKSLNLYEQQETGIRMDPAQFQRYNIDILGYGSNDGDSGFESTAPSLPSDWDDAAFVDGIFEVESGTFTMSPGSKIFTIRTNSVAYPVDAKIVAQFSDTSTINLQDGAFILSTFNDAPYIGFYLTGPSGVAGWYIAESTGVGGNYTYVRSVKGTSFPDPITTTLTAPAAITFYATDPGSVAGWSDYTT